MKAMSLTLAAALAFASISQAFALPGDYKEIECSTQAFFTANNCNQCFEGGKVAVGQKITGLYDTWTNKNATEQIAYKDEQVYPEMVNLGGEGVSWKNTPSDPATFWKYGTEVLWVDSLTGTGKQEFVLDPSKTVTFMEADLGANVSLEKSDKTAGEYVGLMKFPVAFHDVNDAGKDGPVQTHYECVAFASDAVAAPAAPKPAPVPPKATAVKTGPESFLFVALALLLSLSLVAFRRKKA
ncbi:MAG: hypothetical protein QG650_1046 [Patescibacteria group bacterium]|nr:hypothetical protein [Patescibacteria group bacterium]